MYKLNGIRAYRLIIVEKAIKALNNNKEANQSKWNIRMKTLTSSRIRLPIMLLRPNYPSAMSGAAVTASVLPVGDLIPMARQTPSRKEGLVP
jgi:hypothetical protein